MRRIIILFTILISFFVLKAQKNNSTNEDDRVKMEHAQIGIHEDSKSGYKQSTHPDAQWFANAGFGMFIHWSIASVREIDLSWPMMAGTQIGWRAANNKMDSTEVRKIIDSGDYFSGHACKKDNSCLTPNEYWEQAKYFKPTGYNPEEWAKAAKAAGMTYMVFTARHHDGFAMWPSKFGDFNTKNYMSGMDLVKPYVDACRKYGLKVGIYYSGPDWHFNREFQSFMYYGVSRDYKNIPSLDANLQARKTVKTDAEKQAHYYEVAEYIKGQVEELLSNYGKIDMIWFDGGPDIPKGNIAWSKCISMKRIHELQAGIVVSPRFFGYGDYKTYEGDAKLPTDVQKQWAELCVTIAKSGWGYTKNPLKSVETVLRQLILCRSRNTNYLLNFGPTKEGIFSEKMNLELDTIARWMKINGQSLINCSALNMDETASVPATSKNKHRYLFLFHDNNSSEIQLKTSSEIKQLTLLADKKKIQTSFRDGLYTIPLASVHRTELVDVIDVELR